MKFNSDLGILCSNIFKGFSDLTEYIWTFFPFQHLALKLIILIFRYSYICTFYFSQIKLTFLLYTCLECSYVLLCKPNFLCRITLPTQNNLPLCFLFVRNLCILHNTGQIWCSIGRFPDDPQKNDSFFPSLNFHVRTQTHTHIQTHTILWHSPCPALVLLYLTICLTPWLD